ncbi:phosphoribosylaminoimidazole carboxylase ATPase subunit [Oleiphilus messinensis]|uniref:N5-carboxyaminoimidazole ribonucleotide synthase n=1 Tax=Oleiphilus messinensis TaxID=141451 RepID=A0A1Y0ICP7_9GAMM|nr:5-(carboxyamino)imidazole ribonucleotide synthase [Oleiphilus messinensis]ARU58297.1 phosphoribosylaminoimidazole carboxylase ATPase subunit [Oleiphilus messinensis]
MRIGILGAGQLGRMLALAGYPLNMKFSFFDLSGSPTAGVGDIFIDSGKCETQLDAFLDQVDIVTYEFEHLPLELTRKIESKKPLYPSSESIRVCQNRVEEKQLFTRLGIPTPEFRVVESSEELAAAAEELGCPVVAKSVTEGYDGKGQAVLKSADEAEAAWNSIGHPQLIVESFINFSRELSVIAVRSTQDEVAVYPLAENSHHQGILRTSIAPAPDLDPEFEEQAKHYISTLMSELDHIGVLTLELFETEQGLMANEMAPRVHNSGHWTMEGARCSQFENHIRAIAGLPLGCTQARSPTSMLNIIGQAGSIQDLLKLPYTHLHLYGKEERAGRKLGHINICADTYKELCQRTENTYQFLPGSPEFSCSLSKKEKQIP